MASPLTRYEPDRAGLAALLEGEPSYRVDQVVHGLYEQGLDPSAITTLSVDLRERLDASLPLALDVVRTAEGDGGDTVKWLFRLGDGHVVETVLMHHRRWSTVCVSSQAGCAMACGFCATGQAGFDRHLTVGEIVEQIMVARRRAQQDGRRVSRVVFMGMGEPLANYDATWAAVERLHGPLGMSARHITVSTVGVVPGIERMAGEDLPVNLAVSLHKANDADRDQLVPINRRYPLDRLIEACRRWIDAHGRRLSFEWALIDGVNDTERDADELAEIARPLRAHVNLIPLNPTPGWGTPGTPPTGVRRFRNWLDERSVNATVRRTRGTDIDAACGQLRAAEVGIARKPD